MEVMRMNEIICTGFTYREECTVFPGKSHNFKRWEEKKKPKKGNEKKQKGGKPSIIG